MNNFKSGQKVVSLGSSWEYLSDKKVAQFGPKKGEIVTVKEVVERSLIDVCENKVFISIEEYQFHPRTGKCCFNAANFKPLAYSRDAIAEVMEALNKTFNHKEVDVQISEEIVRELERQEKEEHVDGDLME